MSQLSDIIDVLRSSNFGYQSVGVVPEKEENGRLVERHIVVHAKPGVDPHQVACELEGWIPHEPLRWVVKEAEPDPEWVNDFEEYGRALVKRLTLTPHQELE